LAALAVKHLWASCGLFARLKSCAPVGVYARICGNAMTSIACYPPCSRVFCLSQAHPTLKASDGRQRGSTRISHSDAAVVDEDTVATKKYRRLPLGEMPGNFFDRRIFVLMELAALAVKHLWVSCGLFARLKSCAPVGVYARICGYAMICVRGEFRETNTIQALLSTFCRLSSIEISSSSRSMRHIAISRIELKVGSFLSASDIFPSPSMIFW